MQERHTRVTHSMSLSGALGLGTKSVACRAPLSRGHSLGACHTWASLHSLHSASRLQISDTRISDSVSISDLSYTENKLFTGHKFLEPAIISQICVYEFPSTDDCQRGRRVAPAPVPAGTWTSNRADVAKGAPRTKPSMMPPSSW